MTEKEQKQEKKTRKTPKKPTLRRKSGRESGLTDDQIVAMYEKKGGNLTATATALNISRSTLYNWRSGSDELARRLKEVNESLLDYAESALYNHVQQGNLTATIFFLKTKGKRRGYVEGQEIRSSIKVDRRMNQEEAKDLINKLNQDV